MGAVILQLLIKTTLASSLAIAVVLVLRVPLRNYCGVRVAYTIWCLVPLALIAVLLPAREIVVAVASQSGTVDVASAVETMGAPVSAHDSFQDVLLMLWATGLVICGFRFLRQQRRFISSLGLLNHRGENIFLAANNNQGPSVIGVLQPRIVLPSDFVERYSLEEQNLVLSHEKAHMARGDTRVNLFAALLRCIYWFNPLLHWADGRFRFDQELSTDANVLLKFPSARKSYADAMLKTQIASIGVPVTCHWQAHRPLKERILMLKKTTPGKIYRVSGFVLVTSLCLGGAFAAWSVQPAKIITAPAKAAFLNEQVIVLPVVQKTEALPFSERRTVPDISKAAPWRQKLKISFIVDPRRPLNEDEGC